MPPTLASSDPSSDRDWCLACLQTSMTPPLGDGTPFSSLPCCGAAYAAPARPPARPCLHGYSAYDGRIKSVSGTGPQVMCPLYLCTGFEPTAWLLFFEFVVDMVRRWAWLCRR